MNDENQQSALLCARFSQSLTASTRPRPHLASPRLLLRPLRTSCSVFSLHCLFSPFMLCQTCLRRSVRSSSTRCGSPGHRPQTAHRPSTRNRKHARITHGGGSGGWSGGALCLPCMCALCVLCDLCSDATVTDHWKPDRRSSHAILDAPLASLRDRCGSCISGAK